MYSNRLLPTVAQNLHTWPKLELVEISANYFKLNLLLFVPELCTWSSDMVCIRGVVLDPFSFVIGTLWKGTNCAVLVMFLIVWN